MFTLTAKVTCDQCGNHAYKTAPGLSRHETIDPRNVRELAARVSGFVHTPEGRDLCEFCRPGGPRPE